MTHIPNPDQVAQWAEHIKSAEDETEANMIAGEWRKSADCVGVYPNFFVSGEPSAMNAAKAICATCIVAEPCLEYGIRFYTPKKGTELDLATHRFMPIVWGGTTTTERRAILKERASQKGRKN